MLHVRPLPLPVWLALLALPVLACGGEESSAPSAPAGESASVSAARHAPDDVARRVAAVESRVIAWRRDIHRHPELANREQRTAALVADALMSLGLEVRTGVAVTGVVGVLRGGRPGPVVALRADMDALPVSEATGLPYASTERTTYLGRDVGVMHACGHDAHVAILLGAATVLAGMRSDVPGTVVFLFQPAEEGTPPGEEGGADLMIAEGALSDPRPEAIFGLHVVPQQETGQIGWRSGGAMAGSDKLHVVVHGRQTHAAYPWLGIDPIAAAAHVVLALQAIPARRVDARIPSVVSIGTVEGGVRYNIIPDQVEMWGTIRTFDAEQRERVHAEVHRSARAAAEISGARAEVEILDGNPPTRNDPALVRRSLPSLARAVPPGGLVETLPRTGAEDFAYYAREIPGFYFWLGTRPPGLAMDAAAPNHSPEFAPDEAAFALGVRAFVQLVLDQAARAGAP